MNNTSQPLAVAQAEHIDVAETAKMIRKALKVHFPGVTFSVRSERYAGGCSINIHYTDGPRQEDVEAVAKSYQGGGFDGSIDASFSVYSWLAPDGTVSPAFCAGTEGSMGRVCETLNDPHATGCRYVRFSADFVFVNRDVSESAYWESVRRFEREYPEYVIRHAVSGGVVIKLYTMLGYAGNASYATFWAMQDNHREVYRREDAPALSDAENATRAQYLGGKA